MRDTKRLLSVNRLALLRVVGGLLFLLGLFGALLAVVRLGILRENGGGANEQRQTKHDAHQFLHSGLLKMFGQLANYRFMMAVLDELDLKR
jgi:hypothetical protein